MADSKIKKEMKNIRILIAEDNELSRDMSYTYEEWFTDRKNTIYYGDHPYPWTGLGYTYDWGDPGCEVGLSEFVILGGSTVGVQDVVPTADYLGI